jgi:hypothetical protein
MKSTKNRIPMTLVGVLVFLLIAVLAVAVEIQGPAGQRGPAPDPLRPLNMALQQAGASALSVDQAKQILSLIETFHASTSPALPSTTVQQARASYESAIIKGDLDAAKAQVPALVAEQTSNAPVRLQGEAALAISILQVLGTGGDQLARLQKSMSDSQLARLLLSFANGGGANQGPGRGGRNPIKK